MTETLCIFTDVPTPERSKRAIGTKRIHAPSIRPSPFPSKNSLNAKRQVVNRFSERFIASYLPGYKLGA
ncbi:MAG: hypothetical protein QNK27_07480 [Desulfuromusa sp.]|nr:hypothetical protein [Desulfuromusa sp.]